MSRCTLRYIFTVLLYFGVAIFLYPYFTGRLSSGVFYLVGGIGLAVLCGILPCCFTEGDCTEREYAAHKAAQESAQPPSTPSHPHAPSHP
jgi:hypothetical protein